MFSSPVHQTYYGSKRSGDDIEEKLARELQRNKQETQSRQKEYEKICTESEEIRQLKQKIVSAYASKERAAQIAEKQIRKLDDIKRDAEIEDIVLQQNYGQWQKEQQKEEERRLKQLDSKFMLQQQIDEKKLKGEEAYQEYLKERDQVNVIVDKIIQDDIKLIEEDRRKKGRAFKDMIETLEEKRERLIREKMKEFEENRKYIEFTQKKEQEAEQHKAKKAELEAMKDAIFQKLKAEEEQRQRDKEMLEDLRNQLYQEEFAADERMKDRKEIEKKQTQKQQMMQAEKEAHAMKLANKQEEERMEGEFRRMMLDKFATDDKLEQLKAQNRRMKEQEHKREVERLWQERLRVYREEREKEMYEHERKLQEERFKEDIIRREKERLLQEHLPNIADFLPKGIVQTPEELMYASKSKFGSTNKY